ncbi:hypothetical protein HRG_008109 [Hirsutella rhossiliensis]|uniref:Uncharacterized protein n=1 Tax=Hirsutella rhossiliensis TaxID=111463 RepID=A0A9P8MVE9_9HYPO|nr:uncharacterized protein HRG_08109 [Hirsutella rhossiliensis]KAH0960956.1 hypothetical protein HRG_08109 [Hirsutella rhossiliensis]
MKSSSILAVAAFFARGAVSTCELAGTLAGTTCEWQGTAPNCGEAKAGLELGKDTDKGEQLVAWTRDHTWSQLFVADYEISGSRFQLNQDMLPCADQYGQSCWGGYKRLVCNGTKIPQETVDIISSPLSNSPCAQGDEVCIGPRPESSDLAFGYIDIGKGSHRT